MTRRDRLRGHRYGLPGGIEAQVRRSCRNELKLIYEGPCFDAGVWAALAGLGECEILEASRLNPKMKDYYRVRGPGLLIEGAYEGTMLIALYFDRGRLAARHAVERTLARMAAAPGQVRRTYASSSTEG